MKMKQQLQQQRQQQHFFQGRGNQQRQQHHQQQQQQQQQQQLFPWEEQELQRRERNRINGDNGCSKYIIKLVVLIYLKG